MANATPAPTGASRPLLPFSISIRSPGSAVRFTALARSSGDALCNALALLDLAAPIAASGRPLQRP